MREGRRNRAVLPDTSTLACRSDGTFSLDVLGLWGSEFVTEELTPWWRRLICPTAPGRDSNPLLTQTNGRRNHRDRCWEGEGWRPLSPACRIYIFRRCRVKGVALSITANGLIPRLDTLPFAHSILLYIFFMLCFQFFRGWLKFHLMFQRLFSF